MRRRHILYVRVSTDRQGISVDAQKERLLASAAMRGIPEEDTELVVDEDASGKDLKRPGIERIMKAIEHRQVASVTIVRADRVARNLGDLIKVVENCAKRKCEFISLQESFDTSTPVGRMMLHIMGAFAEFERETIRSRVRTALAHKKQKGERVGSVPYGYRAGKNERGPDGRTVKAAVLELDPYEDEVLERMRSLRAHGHTYQEIADWINAHGYRTRAGTPWQGPFVRRILVREKAG